MLFDGERLTGMLDFDLTVRGIRLFDPCYHATSLLVDHWEDEAAHAKWPRLFRAVMRGYVECNPLSAAEQQAVADVPSAIQFIFIAFCADCDNMTLARRNQAALFWLAEHRESLAAAPRRRAKKGDE